MLLALRDLDHEGFFGTGPVRQGVTLYCNVSDSERAGWLQAESAQRLNPPEVYEVFAKDWLAPLADEIAAARRDPGPMYQAFLEAVGGSSR
jgi:hypothetical protein